MLQRLSSRFNCFTLSGYRYNFDMADTSLFERRFDPIQQAAVCLGGVLIANLLGLGFQAAGGGGEAAEGLADGGNRFPWLAVTAFMLFFAIFNAVFSVASKELFKYWSRSIYAYMGLAGLGGLIAWGLSGLSIWEAGSYSWMYIVVTVGYLVFISMITMMRKVVEFAQREEWNAPKIRQKKRRR
jgi:hypothetical protein